MINSGIIRKIDELGRIVLPKEIRKYLCINPGDDFQIIIDDKRIILEKYSKLESLESRIDKIIKCFEIDNKFNILITNSFKIINKENEEINNDIKKIILTRKAYIS